VPYDQQQHYALMAENGVLDGDDNSQAAFAWAISSQIIAARREAAMHRVGPDARDSDYQGLAEVARQFELGTVTVAQEVADGLLNRSWSVLLSGNRRVFIKQVADGDRAQAVWQHTPLPEHWPPAGCR
jgi:hypothetical protein